jgi:hypothetical protein
METTNKENPEKETIDFQGCDADTVSTDAPPVNFAEQLREIDRDIQKFKNANLRGKKLSSLDDVADGSMSCGSPKPQAQLTPTFSATQQKPNKITWKKMARAAGKSPSKPALPALVKRTRESGEDDRAMEVKRSCGTVFESSLETLLSAEAVTQPRREP